MEGERKIMKKVLPIIIIGILFSSSIVVQGAFFEKISEEKKSFGNNDILFDKKIELLMKLSKFPYFSKNSGRKTDDCGCNTNGKSLILPYVSSNSMIPEQEIIVSKIPDDEYPFLNIIPEEELPSYFNWKDKEGKDFTTPAKNQDNCGSCWDFAAMGTIESIIKIRENNSKITPDLSEQYVLSCLPAAANNYAEGCNGGQPVNAYKYIISNGEDGNFCNGIIWEECFPYRASHNIECSEKCDNWEDYLVPISDYGYFHNMGVLQNSKESRTLIKNALYQHGPISSFMDVTFGFQTWGFIHNDQEEYYPYKEREFKNRLNHAIIIIGWKDDPSIGNGGYWICKNSWGENWGSDGFYNIEYGTHFTGLRVDWVDYNKTDFYWPPRAQIGDHYSATVNNPILFDASRSCGSEDSAIDSYNWDFGDGNNASGKTITHSYSQEGSYQLTLSIKDKNESTSKDTATVIISSEPISIDLLTGFLQAKMKVINPSEYTLKNIRYNIEFDGKHLVFGDFSLSGYITLSPGEHIIDTGKAWGFAQVPIYITLGENIVKSEKITIIGPFIFAFQ